MNKAETRETMRAKLMGAIELHKPAIAKQYERIVREQYESMLSEFGPTFRNVYNSARYKAFKQYVIGNCRMVKDPDNQMKLHSSNVVLDGALLAKNADNYAGAILTAWFNKIVDKVGDLDDVNVSRIDGFRFNITGTRPAIHDPSQKWNIRIVQDMIINRSPYPHSTLFNQFPSRIYVNGIFTSEAKYKSTFN